MVGSPFCKHHSSLYSLKKNYLEYLARVEKENTNQIHYNYQCSFCQQFRFTLSSVLYSSFTPDMSTSWNRVCGLVKTSTHLLISLHCRQQPLPSLTYGLCVLKGVGSQGLEARDLAVAWKNSPSLCVAALLMARWRSRLTHSSSTSPEPLISLYQERIRMTENKNTTK